MPVKAKQEKKESSKIQFFGEVDLNKEGGIKSDMPSWYLEPHIDYMEEDIKRKETSLAQNRISSDRVPAMREEIKRERARIDEIKASKPVLNDAQKDRCARAYESLKHQISDSMPTRKQARDGLVNPYDEMRRLKDKRITIEPALAKSLGVKTDHGKITGDAANKCFQILGKVLGEPTNPETLRRDHGVESQKIDLHDLTRAIMEGKEIKGDGR